MAAPEQGRSVEQNVRLAFLLMSDGQMLSFLRISIMRFGFQGTWRSGFSLLSTLGSRGAAALGGVAFSYVVAQIGGATSLGGTAQIISCLVIAALIIRFGTDHSLLRICANLDVMGRGRDALSYLIAALMGGALIAILVCIGGLLLIQQLEFTELSRRFATILVWSLPGLVVGQIASACLKGFRYSAMAVFVELGAISGITAILVHQMTSPDMEVLCRAFVLIANASAVIAMIIAVAVVLIRTSRVSSLDGDPYTTPKVRDFLANGWPFMLSGLSLLATQSGSFAIGSLELSENQLGELRIAERLALLIGFAMTAIGPFMAPRIAAAWTMAGAAGARRSYRQAVLTSLAFAIPAMIGIAILGPTLLRLFGPGFGSAYPLLLIMALGQLAYAALSPLNVLLQTTGHEHQAMLISVITLIAGAGALWLGSALWGTTGFASAYSLTIILRGILAHRVAHRYILSLGARGS